MKAVQSIGTGQDRTGQNRQNRKAYWVVTVDQVSHMKVRTQTLMYISNTCDFIYRNAYAHKNRLVWLISSIARREVSDSPLLARLNMTSSALGRRSKCRHVLRSSSEQNHSAVERHKEKEREKERRRGQREERMGEGRWEYCEERSDRLVMLI